MTYRGQYDIESIHIIQIAVLTTRCDVSQFYHIASVAQVERFPFSTRKEQN